MTCRACGGDRLDVVFEMDPMPLAGAFAKTYEAALAATRYPLEWRWCRECGLVNVFPDIPDHELYGRYAYRSSQVPALVAHHRDLSAWLATRFPDTRRVLEIGGNDGVLLSQLPPGWDKVNVDPSDVARSSPGDWLGIGAAWPTDAGTFDLITSSNAFAHFSDIGAGLAAVRDALMPEGRFVIEVHDLDALLAAYDWPNIYHEHKVEWSATALVNAAGVHGLELVDLSRVPLHGGLIRAVFRRGERRYPQPGPSPDTTALRRAYLSRTPTGAHYAYGASGRATVYLNQVPEAVLAVFDDSGRRIGRYIPGTGTPILPGDNIRNVPAASSTLITAWPHAEDIMARHPEYRGRWVTA